MTRKTKKNRSSQAQPRQVSGEQLRWLVDLRWIAVAGILIMSWVVHQLFPVIHSVGPVLICGLVLGLCNAAYYATGKRFSRVNHGVPGLVFALVQIELDLLILTVLLYFSGGLTNPFVLFYVFHVIIAAIMLPLYAAFAVGGSTVVLYGILALNQVSTTPWPGFQDLSFSQSTGVWHVPIYVLGSFVAFSCTVGLAQYLTRVILVRMTAKEREAAQNHDVLKAVIHAMNEGLVFVDSTRRIAMCNPAARAWTTAQPAEVLTLDKFPAVLRDHLRAALVEEGSLTEQDVGAFQTPGPTPLHIKAKGCPVVDVDGRSLGYVIVGTDVTDHKNLEQELTTQTEQVTSINEMLKTTRVQMAQREKMVAIGQMASGIAHEIGNPLASLSSVVQYLAKKIKTEDEVEQLNVVLNQVTRISEILKRMLTFSRPATSEYRWSDIDQLISSTLTLIKFDKRMQSIDIKNQVNGTLPTVWLNPQSFEQILLNVFINAVDAMNAKTDESPSTLRITRDCQGDVVRIRVEDTGIGMDQQVARRAFESFFTTKEIGKGTGLGLFISHNLITELDGSISIESEPGKGTSVLLQVPVRPKADMFMSEKKVII
ncbi:MAG: PAS domain-containing protein [Planctomycetes bacterium]|nr:PAS domain-containing protein [Planctomycetota bacterium]